MSLLKLLFSLPIPEPLYSHKKGYRRKTIQPICEIHNEERREHATGKLKLNGEPVTQLRCLSCEREKVKRLREKKKENRNEKTN